MVWVNFPTALPNFCLLCTLVFLSIGTGFSFFFSLSDFKLFLFFSFFAAHYGTRRCVFLFTYPYWCSLSFMDLWFEISHYFWKILCYYLLKYFSRPICLPSSPLSCGSVRAGHARLVTAVSLALSLVSAQSRCKVNAR